MTFGYFTLVIRKYIIRQLGRCKLGVAVRVGVLRLLYEQVERILKLKNNYIIKIKARVL